MVYLNVFLKKVKKKQRKLLENYQNTTSERLTLVLKRVFPKKKKKNKEKKG